MTNPKLFWFDVTALSNQRLAFFGKLVPTYTSCVFVLSNVPRRLFFLSKASVSLEQLDVALFAPLTGAGVQTYKAETIDIKLLCEMPQTYDIVTECQEKHGDVQLVQLSFTGGFVDVKKLSALLCSLLLHVFDPYPSLQDHFLLSKNIRGPCVLELRNARRVPKLLTTCETEFHGSAQDCFRILQQQQPGEEHADEVVAMDVFKCLSIHTLWIKTLPGEKNSNKLECAAMRVSLDGAKPVIVDLESVVYTGAYDQDCLVWLSRLVAETQTEMLLCDGMCRVLIPLLKQCAEKSTVHSLPPLGRVKYKKWPTTSAAASSLKVYAARAMLNGLMLLDAESWDVSAAEPTSILVNAMHTAIVCGLPFSKCLKPSRIDKVESLVLWRFQELGLIPACNSSQHSEAKAKDETFEGGLNLPVHSGWYKEPVALYDFSSMYPSLICEFRLCVTRSKEVIPWIVERLVNLRTSSCCVERASSLKLLANSVYGCLGNSGFRFFSRAVASAVASAGRSLLTQTAMIFEKELGYEVIYGATDSLMVRIGISDDSTSKANEILSHAKQALLSSGVHSGKYIRLSLDRIFERILLFRSNMYAGKVMYSSRAPKDQEHALDFKGVEILGCNYCPIAQRLGRRILLQLLVLLDSPEKVKFSVDLVLKTLREQSLIQTALEIQTWKRPASLRVFDESEKKASRFMPVSEYKLTSSSPLQQVRLDWNWYAESQIKDPINRMVEMIPSLRAYLEASAVPSSSSASSTATQVKRKREDCKLHETKKQKTSDVKQKDIFSDFVKQRNEIFESCNKCWTCGECGFICHMLTPTVCLKTNQRTYLPCICGSTKWQESITNCFF